MAYTENKEPLELTALTTLATNDVFVVGDASDTSEVVKYITLANLLTLLQASLDIPAFETPTGTVNSSNVTFTVSATPKAIIADGATYFENAGFSLSGLTVTMDVPPSQYIRAII